MSWVAPPSRATALVAASGAEPDLIAGPEHAAIRTELSRYRLDPERYLTRRPPWGFGEDPEPWLPPKA